MTEKIPFKEWEKLEFVVGKILNVESHPNADKLYIMEVDLGDEKRKLVAGLKAHYTEKKLKGKHVIVFKNLEPAIIRGIKSEGMVLAAVNKDRSKVCLLEPDDDIELGSRVS
ncbi:hypothetical protein AUJ10_01250 [Candidatus Pacearchaeota archaeon CG1_02_31_27]|nr:MAG: hypothetical protein AUJ10_01250 [Candidatus Pacearchaeota archaeon CG1_02_31_27]PIN92035.1 MAG: hypothetical protein COU55_03160 [Candidatus Pacearchaeota archaeon CG10_big_fil_rev_8_21_14_0_10_31_59]PIZ81119.1 MAG: hypothetical protein COX99_00770 [Candidatus Pacearchaeota archaeon CG_4_10_14_0_2_um_filter_31_10]